MTTSPTTTLTSSPNTNPFAESYSANPRSPTPPLQEVNDRTDQVATSTFQNITSLKSKKILGLSVVAVGAAATITGIIASLPWLIVAGVICTVVGVILLLPKNKNLVNPPLSRHESPRNSHSKETQTTSLTPRPSITSTPSTTSITTTSTSTSTTSQTSPRSRPEPELEPESKQVLLHLTNATTTSSASPKISPSNSPELLPQRLFEETSSTAVITTTSTSTSPIISSIAAPKSTDAPLSPLATTTDTILSTNSETILTVATSTAPNASNSANSGGISPPIILEDPLPSPLSMTQQLKTPQKPNANPGGEPSSLTKTTGKSSYSRRKKTLNTRLN